MKKLINSIKNKFNSAVISADYDTDDDLDTGVDIALTGGGLDGSSCGDDGGVALVLDGVDKLFHRLITSFFL